MDTCLLFSNMELVLPSYETSKTNTAVFLFVFPTVPKCPKWCCNLRVSALFEEIVSSLTSLKRDFKVSRNVSGFTLRCCIFFLKKIRKFLTFWDSPYPPNLISTPGFASLSPKDIIIWCLLLVTRKNLISCDIKLEEIT